MASAPKPLSVEEFHKFYSGKKPYYEFWFGEAIQKSSATWLHGVLQGILGEFLNRAGYKTGSEVELRIDPDWEPVPDLVATRKKVEQPYPTTPVEIVIEILSPDDRMMHVLQKCRHYSRIGITKIFVLDPEGRQAWEWNAGCLELTPVLKLTNGEVIDLAEVWQELAKQVRFSSGAGDRFLSPVIGNDQAILTAPPQTTPPRPALRQRTSSPRHNATSAGAPSRSLEFR